jgi:hypothetical protein
MSKSGKKKPKVHERKKRKTLTVRQAKYIQERAKGKTQAQAAEAAGYSTTRADQSGYQVEKQLRGRVPELLDSVGLSERSLIEKYLVPVLNAKEVIEKWCEKKKKDIEAATILAAMGLSHSGLRTAFELHGSYAPKLYDNQAQQPPVNVIIDLQGPDWSKPPNNIPQLPPGDLHPQQRQQASGNGHRKDAVIEDDDPRPRD